MRFERLCSGLPILERTGLDGAARGRDGRPVPGELDGSDWTSIPTRVRPPASILPAITTGLDGRHVLLFGGEDSTGTLRAETWWFGKLPRRGH
jgi:hypothetical protein